MRNQADGYFGSPPDPADAVNALRQFCDSLSAQERDDIMPFASIKTAKAMRLTPEEIDLAIKEPLKHPDIAREMHFQMRAIVDGHLLHDAEDARIVRWANDYLGLCDQETWERNEPLQTIDIVYKALTDAAEFLTICAQIDEAELDEKKRPLLYFYASADLFADQQMKIAGGLEGQALEDFLDRGSRPKPPDNRCGL